MSPPPRVGLNLLWLVPGVVGGSEEYTLRLLAALADRAPGEAEVVVFGNRLVLAAYPELRQRLECVEAPVTGASKARRVLAENTWMAAAARRHGVDLVHHLGGIMPFVRSAPGVLTIHDLQPLVMPEHFHPVKRWFARLSIPPSVRQARLIITLTEFTRRMAIERFGIDPSRVEVIPAGVRVPDEAQVAAARSLGVRERYGLADDRFFLYPAITYPHKNHEFLVRAFAPVAAGYPGVRLVLTGGPAQEEQALARVIEELGLADRVRRLGRIPREHLDALYLEATALVFPSRFEGFGIPLLEAMARGCPVVAADATALPEVGGDAAVLLPLEDVDRWSAELARLLDDDPRRAELAAAGRARAGAFDWPAVADRVLGAYRRAAGGAGVGRPMRDAS